VDSCGAPAEMRRGSEEELRGGEALDNLHGSAAKRTLPQRVNGPRRKGGAGCWRMGLVEQARTEWKEFCSPPRTPKHLVAPGNAAQHLIANSERIRKELGYTEPLETDVAIHRTIEWEQANPPNGTTFHQFDYSAEDAALNS